MRAASFFSCGMSIRPFFPVLGSTRGRWLILVLFVAGALNPLAGEQSPPGTGLWQPMELSAAISLASPGGDLLGDHTPGFLPTSTQPLALSVEDAILAAVRNNHDLEIHRLEIRIEETDPQRERATFDPNLAGTLANSDRLGKSILPSGVLSDSVTNRSDGEITWSRMFPSGTQAEVSINMLRNRSNRAAKPFSPRLGFDIQKPLRRGAGRDVNLVSLRKQELEVQISRHELAGYLLSLTADVESRYWNLFLAQKELEIVRETRRLAAVQLAEVDKKIAVGSIPESERAAAEAELALREEDLINALSAVDKARIALLRLVNINSERFWDFDLHLSDAPPDVTGLVIELDKHLSDALVLRPDLLEAGVRLNMGNLDLVQTRNGLLPQLDVFVTLGRTGYSRTFSEVRAAFSERGYDLQAGVTYELPLHRREARSRHRRAVYNRNQLRESIKNLKQLVQEDVLNAFLEVQRTREQMKATAKTKAKQLEKLRVEEVRFQVGKNTAFQVAQAQRDYAAARIAEMKAGIAFITAVTELYRLDGSLCLRRGVVSAEKR